MYGFVCSCRVEASNYLSLDELEVAGEEEVCAAALTWLHACPCDHQSDIISILSSVRLEYLDASYIQHRILGDRVSSNLFAAETFASLKPHFVAVGCLLRFVNCCIIVVFGNQNHFVFVSVNDIQSNSVLQLFFIRPIRKCFCMDKA